LAAGHQEITVTEVGAMAASVATPKFYRGAEYTVNRPKVKIEIAVEETLSTG
jgi:nitrogen regulatory protein PII